MWNEITQPVNVNWTFLHPKIDMTAVIQRIFSLLDKTKLTVKPETSSIQTPLVDEQATMVKTSYADINASLTKNRHG